MPNDRLNPVTEKIWAFVRGDMSPTAFERWLYSETSLENLFGRDLYMEAIAANYADRAAVEEIRNKLAAYARSASPLRCQCVPLPRTSVLDMGDTNADAFFSTLDEQKERGEPYWWLSLYQCRECLTWWLVAQEERQNDIFCMRRLSPDTASDILNKDCWPDIFDRYETLIRIGYHTARRWRFADPLNSSLRWTIDRKSVV